jgi:hypothetical protein
MGTLNDMIEEGSSLTFKSNIYIIFFPGSDIFLGKLRYTRFFFYVFFSFNF